MASSTSHHALILVGNPVELPGAGGEENTVGDSKGWTGYLHRWTGY